MNEINCADYTLDPVFFSASWTGMKVMNIQGVNYYVYGITADSVTTLFDLEHGGDFHWWGGGVTGTANSTILKIRGGGSLHRVHAPTRV